MTARIFRLTELHQKIDAQLRVQQRRKFPDQFAIAKLKKLKLRAKDMLHRMTSRRSGASR